jgi:hypothetical protein
MMWISLQGPTFMKHLTSFVSDKLLKKVNDVSEEGVGGCIGVTVTTTIDYRQKE